MITRKPGLLCPGALWLTLTNDTLNMLLKIIPRIFEEVPSVLLT